MDEFNTLTKSTRDNKKRDSGKKKKKTQCLKQQGGGATENKISQLAKKRNHTPNSGGLV